MSAQSGPDVAALLCTRAHGMGRTNGNTQPCAYCRADAKVIREAYADWLTEIAGEWAQLSRDQRPIAWRELAIGRAWAATRLTAVADLRRGQA